MQKSDLDVQKAANARIAGNLAFNGVEGEKAELYRVAFEAGVATTLATMRDWRMFRPILIDGPNGKPMRRFVI